MNDSIPSHTDNDVESAIGNDLSSELPCIVATSGLVLDGAVGVCDITKVGSNVLDERFDPLFVDLDSGPFPSEGIDNDTESSSF
jgi:hypothetical protein